MQTSELYKKKRGTYMDIKELPFDKAVTPKEVLDALNRGKQYDDSAAFKQYCSFDSVDNAKKLCSLLLGKRNEVSIRNIPKSGKKQMYVFNQSFEKNSDTAKLKKFIEKQKEYVVYAGCSMDDVDQHKDGAYPFFHNIPVIGAENNAHFSSSAKKTIELLKKGEIEFETAIRILRYDYKVAARRLAGGARFNRVMIHNVTRS